MWIRFECVVSNEEFIIVPECFSKQLKSTCSIMFGETTTLANVIFSYNIEYNKNSSYENPFIIKLSSELKNRLLIPETQIYQLKIEDNNIKIGPVIGFLLGFRNHAYNTKHMKKYNDRFGTYNKIGGLIYAFSPKSVNWEKGIVYGLYYNILKSKWEYGKFPLPSVVYRRDFHQSSAVIDKLISVTKGKLFNSYRFTKLELFDFVAKDKELAKNLPITEYLNSYEQFESFINQHEKVILKPVDLSRGRGICIVEKDCTKYNITDYRRKNAVKTSLCENKELKKFFINNKNFENNYLIQECIPLAKIKNSLFDIRVVMQKQNIITWKCAGIECRVSKPQSQITNISRGGYALPINEALTLAYPNEDDITPLIKQIYEYCFKFCKHMDTMGRHFAEFGMDIALDENKNLWLIEANVFPSFKGFKKMDYNKYIEIRHNPLLYALSLTDFGENTVYK